MREGCKLFDRYKLGSANLFYFVDAFYERFNLAGKCRHIKRKYNVRSGVYRQVLCDSKYICSVLGEHRKNLTEDTGLVGKRERNDCFSAVKC